MPDQIRTKFAIGQLVHHKLFDYRGVIVDVDPVFQGSDEWYEFVAKSRPPKDAPWYHVLVHENEHITYVAERNLEQDTRHDRIIHPLISYYFDTFDNGAYSTANKMN